MKVAQIIYNTKDSEWETLDQRRTIARLFALFKAYCGERSWKLYVQVAKALLFE